MPSYSIYPVRAPVKYRKLLIGLALGGVIGAIGSIYLSCFLFKVYFIPGESMAPTIGKGESIFGLRFTYWLSSLQRGDVIFYWNDNGMGKGGANLYVKRVVALSGDVIKFSSDKLYVNGILYRYPGQTVDYSLLHNNMEIVTDDEKYTVPAGTFFVVGDNVSNSLDSRMLGAIPLDHLRGKIYAVVWPPSRVSLVH